MKSQVSHCVRCGGEFLKLIKPGNQPDFCSQNCKRAHVKQYLAAWQQQNRLKVAERRNAQRDKVREWDRGFYERHKERRKALRRKHYLENTAQTRESQRRYSAENPDKIRAIGRKSRATRRAHEFKAFVERVDPRVVFKRDGGICGICRLPIGDEEWHVDHVIPLAKGGRHAYDNVQAAHGRCNRAKGARVLV